MRKESTSFPTSRTLIRAFPKVNQNIVLIGGVPHLSIHPRIICNATGMAHMTSTVDTFLEYSHVGVSVRFKRPWPSAQSDKTRPLLFECSLSQRWNQTLKFQSRIIMGRSQNSTISGNRVSRNISKSAVLYWGRNRKPSSLPPSPIHCNKSCGQGLMECGSQTVTAIEGTSMEIHYRASSGTK